MNDGGVAWEIFAAIRAGLSYDDAVTLPIGLVRDIIAVMIKFSHGSNRGGSVQKTGGKKIYIDEIPSVR